MTIFSFTLAAITIALAGTKISKIADKLADRTGLGEALMGGVFLGACTSISGSVLSISAAIDSQVDLAVGNALGGIAAQTFFLFFADLIHKKANLEHAAASTTNMMQTALLIGLLSVPLFAANSPNITIWGVHPFSIAIFCAYLFGLYYIYKQKYYPMWRPRKTSETKTDIPLEVNKDISLFRLWLYFLILTLILFIAGLVIKKSGVQLANQWNISHLALGAIFTAIATSLPELIVTLTAVRIHALTLAVAIIVGGNTFDILFISFSDIAYREGSIYHQMNLSHFSLIGLVISMNAVLLLGLIRREKHGIANIGMESLVMASIYIIGLFLVL